MSKKRDLLHFILWLLHGRRLLLSAYEKKYDGIGVFNSQMETLFAREVFHCRNRPFKPQIPFGAKTNHYCTT